MNLINADDLIDYLKRVTVTEGITFETGFKQILSDIKRQPKILGISSCNYWDSKLKTCRRSDVPKIAIPLDVNLDEAIRNEEFKVIRFADVPEPKIENRWIPVTERLPEKGEQVMACDIDGDIMIGWMHDRTHLCAVDDYYKNITAWMPLPEPWKGDEE